MRLLRYRSVLIILAMAAPAGAFAATSPTLSCQAGLAAVILWLAGLGWGFQTMLHHRLAAEDRLARLESDVACERDARAAQRTSTHLRMLALEAEWFRLEECLRDGDIRHVPDSVRAMQEAITLLYETA